MEEIVASDKRTKWSDLVIHILSWDRFVTSFLATTNIRNSQEMLYTGIDFRVLYDLIFAEIIITYYIVFTTYPINE